MNAKEFNDLIKKSLESILFTSYRGIFIHKFNNKIFATIGFGTVWNRKNKSLFVNPVLGIYYKEVEDLFFELTKNKSHFQSSVSTPLGYLTTASKYLEWEFNEYMEFQTTCNDLLETIKSYGLPYVNRLKDWTQFIKEFEDSKYTAGFIKDYKLPIIYYLNGEKSKGLEFIEQKIKQNSIIDNRYLQFHKNFTSL
jgi:hypothetical protein